MIKVISRFFFALLLIPCLSAVTVAQQAIHGGMGNNYLIDVGTERSPSTSDPGLSSTGQDYWGFDLGLTYSWYLGSQNFFWPVNDAANAIMTPLQFDNLGTGIGG